MGVGTAMLIGAGVGLVTGGIGALSAGKQHRDARTAGDAVSNRIWGENGQMAQYLGADISNPFADMTNRFADVTNPYADLESRFEGMQNQFEGMQNQYAGLENTMEDLTINQKQADFQSQQFAQSQANIMGNLRGAAGGSGIASLAQSLAQQGQLASQKSAASIGQQEAANQMAAAQQAGKLQEMEARGAEGIDMQQRQAAAAIDMQQRQALAGLDMASAQGDWAQQMAVAQGAAQLDALKGQGEQWEKQMNLDRLATQLGMSQAELAAHMEQESSANTALFDSLSSMGSNLTNLGMSIFGDD